MGVTLARSTSSWGTFWKRAKELMELYNGLRLPLLTIDERLDVLLHVKWTVKEFDCNLTRDIVELIDREADMLNRYLEMIQVQRQDFNGRVLTIRSQDLQALAAILGTSVDEAVPRIDALGLAYQG